MDTSWTRNRFSDFVADEMGYCDGDVCSKAEAQYRAVERVLEGYRNLEEAQEDAACLEETGGVRFSVSGRPVSPATLRTAIMLAEKHQIKIGRNEDATG